MNRDKALRTVGASLTALLLAVCGLQPRGWAGPAGRQKVAAAKQSATAAYAPEAGPAGRQKVAAAKQSATAAYAPEAGPAFMQRFQADIWPLLTRNCTACHGASNPSQLHFAGDAGADFKTLLAGGHFDPENPAGLLARVTLPEQVTAHMPPKPAPAWTDAEVTTLRRFVNDLYAQRRQAAGPKLDEMFPQALLTPYVGRAATKGDNTFLTYYQLRGKIKTLFNDDWKRDDRDLFTANLAQFGGADFVRSYNESARPTAQFLSGMDALATDVASRAYLTGSGPFAGYIAGSLPSPLNMSAPNGAYSREIDRLYQRLLFRPATPAEIQQSFGLLRSLYAAQKEIAAASYQARFDLIARDERGLTTTQEFSIHVANDRYGLGQTLVNENDASITDDRKQVARARLDGPYTFKASDAGQQVVVSNINTHGTVLVSGIEIRGPLPDGATRLLSITDPTAQPQGAWRLTKDNGVACYEDDNQNKGASSLIFPIKVEKDGQYELTLNWRAAPRKPRTRGGRKIFAGPNANNVLVEVQSYDKDRLAIPAAPPAPPAGEAHFSVDESDDTVSYRDLKTTFLFGPGDGVEISNTDTRNSVVADALRFTPVAIPSVTPTGSGASPFLILAKEAAGQEKWKQYQKGEYTFYNPVGPRVVTDDGDPELKGKLSLLYRPDVHKAEWKPETYYGVAVGYPGEIRNDAEVPVIVHARASSPIMHVGYPLRAHIGATVTLDASGSYNVQHTPLQFTWRQVGGAQVKLSDPHTAKVSFVAPTLTAQQAAWEGLCRALLKHPDFLFTRPLALAVARDTAIRRRLQLVKIAQDLVGRPPTPAELDKVAHGAALSALVDDYLASPEFADFYFRRIRLYLESHGTDEDDEPARLWSWIAFNDRPFKEILTADYTIDANWRKQPRSAYCGKSGVLTMKGFIKGKPGLPHFNYAAQVCEKFLGYVFEVPPEIVKIRNGIAAASTTSPSSVCYSCHKILTPLAYQRERWTDKGEYREKDAQGHLIDDSDHQLVPSYAFKGNGLEAFALQAQNKERFIRTMIQTHFIFYFGREMRVEKEERGLYKRLWDTEKTNNYNLKGLIRTLVLSPEYLQERG